MEAGIVGLPNVGKSTLFNALTDAGIASENYPFCTIEPNVGAVPVPDPRLEKIHRYIETQKVIPAVLQLVDIAGLVRGASRGEGLGNQFLGHIRNVDAILHIVRCFENTDITHVDGAVDPIRDIETIDTELLLADLAAVETATDKAERAARAADKDAKSRLVVLNQCLRRLEAGKPVRGLSFPDPMHAKTFRDLHLLTAKPVLYVANVDEEAAAELRANGSQRAAAIENEFVAQVVERAREEGNAVVPICASIEAELLELDETDQREMLASLGLAEPALAVLARAAHQLLGLQTFFTAGPKEIRAWTIPIGSTAPQAAGVIHSDFERGFIRAETYSIADLENYKTEKAIKEAGKMRVEGKEYIVQDGDVIYFLFNV